MENEQTQNAKAKALSEAFMFKIYSCAKYVMSIFAALCLVVAVCSAIFAILRRSSGIETPDFDDYKIYFETDSTAKERKSDLSGVKDVRQVDKKYGDIIQDCVEMMEVSGNEATIKYESLKATLCRLDEAERGDYIKGLRSFISDAVSYSKKNEKIKKILKNLDEVYSEEFESARKYAKARAEEASEARMASWRLFGFSLLFLLASLFLPLLLQIEENTRKSIN